MRSSTVSPDRLAFEFFFLLNCPERCFGCEFIRFRTNKSECASRQCNCYNSCVCCVLFSCLGSGIGALFNFICYISENYLITFNDRQVFIYSVEHVLGPQFRHRSAFGTLFAVPSSLIRLPQIDSLRSNTFDLNSVKTNVCFVCRMCMVPCLFRDGNFV